MTDRPPVHTETAHFAAGFENVDLANGTFGTTFRKWHRVNSRK